LRHYFWIGDDQIVNGSARKDVWQLGEVRRFCLGGDSKLAVFLLS
jgi:hypothetical protein